VHTTGSEEKERKCTENKRDGNEGMRPEHIGEE